MGLVRIAGVALVVGCADPGDSQRESPPNLLVVVFDDLGVDNVAAYEAHPAPPVTDTLDRLAAEGVLFRRFYTNQLCSPSRASLITGLQPYDNGVSRHIWGNDTLRLRRGVTIVPQALDGYASAAVGKWHLGGRLDHRPNPPHAVTRGFDQYGGTPDNYGWGDGQWETYFHYLAVYGSDDGPAVWMARDGYSMTDEVDAVLALSQTLPEPWLIWLGFHAPHVPNHVPPRALNPGGVTEQDGEPAMYDAMVRAADMELGRLLDEMDDDVLERTTVFALGDNGSPQMVVEPYPPWGPGKNTPFESGIHTPLIVAGAGVATGEVDTLVSHTDLFATLVELSESDSSVPEESRSFAPLLADPSEAPTRDLVYTELIEPLPDGTLIRDDRIVVGERFKLIRRIEWERLYDLDSDPLEQINLLDAPLTPEAATALEGLRAELARHDALAGR